MTSVRVMHICMKLQTLVEAGYKDGVSEQRLTCKPSVISTTLHSGADALHVTHEFGGLENLAARRSLSELGLFTTLRFLQFHQCVIGLFKTWYGCCFF